MGLCKQHGDFPSFWEGLSLRQHGHSWLEEDEGDFPSFLEGLSLRREVILSRSFPPGKISLPFWRGFH